jgi:hypothetical protein
MSPGRLVSTNIRLALALIAVFLIIGGGIVGAFGLSVYEANRSRDNLCAAFETVVKPPSAPRGSPQYARQEQSWQGWLTFSRRLGCPRP